MEPSPPHPELGGHQALIHRQAEQVKQDPESPKASGEQTGESWSSQPWALCPQEAMVGGCYLLPVHLPRSLAQPPGAGSCGGW